MTPEEKRKKIDDLIIRISITRNDAMNLGLALTGHKIKEAMKQIGWDLEYLITKGKVDEKSTF